ncbi:gag-polypeptide of LTR copia-type [Sesbania bispinosa]|nr:gag-polypeptide of LTR copia-type [Sesbania bispinosa]
MAMLKNNDQIPAKLPVFDRANYERWTAQMKVVFRYQGVLDIILTDITPLETNPTEAHRATHREQMKKDDKAIFLIHQCVDSNVLEKIIDYETAKEAWDILATTYAGDKQTKKVRLMALRRQLGLLQMESNETMAKFVNRGW